MHVIALVNQKGGCGKTTVAVNLSAALAARGQRVLLVDLDPQAHATLALGQAVEDARSTFAVLRGRASARECSRRVPGGFELVPAQADLAEFEELAERELGPERALTRALESALDWDVAVLDCPPRADGVLAANALRAADTALLVIECGVFALQGAVRAVEVLERMQATMDAPFVLRAVATLFDRETRVGRETLVGMQSQFGPLLFETPIRASADLRECPAFGQPVLSLAPRSAAADDFCALAAEFEEHFQAEYLRRESSRTRGSGRHHQRKAARASAAAAPRG